MAWCDAMVWLVDVDDPDHVGMEIAVVADRTRRREDVFEGSALLAVRRAAEGVVVGGDGVRGVAVVEGPDDLAAGGHVDGGRQVRRLDEDVGPRRPGRAGRPAAEQPGYEDQAGGGREHLSRPHPPLPSAPPDDGLTRQ